MAERILRGRVLAPHASEAAFSLLPDALIRVEASGRIAAVEAAPPGCGVPETWPGAVLLPGLVDTHLHFPQTRVIGSASGPLLPWLQRSVFPEESRFCDRPYAEAVAAEFCTSMLRQGTTTAGIYSSSHPDATDVLFAALDRCGMRALAGLTWMNRGAPALLLRDTAEAIDASEALIARWHGHDSDRLRFCLTPRFALSCDSAMLRAAGDLAARYGLWIQTHIAENNDEGIFTAEAFPDARDYLAVYEDHGLLGPRTILAHCIHLSDSEWTRVVAAGAVVAHCPDSNFFLGSGCMPLARARAEGARVGLGTDVGAGRTFSVRRVCASAYDASLVRGAPVSPEALLWLATRGGALALGLGEVTGCLAPGFEADLIAVDAPEGMELGPLIDALLFRHDAGPVRATVVRGRV